MRLWIILHGWQKKTNLLCWQMRSAWRSLWMKPNPRLVIPMWIFISDGSIMDADNGATLKQRVEQIIVEISGIEIQFQCGVSIEKDYK